MTRGPSVNRARSPLAIAGPGPTTLAAVGRSADTAIGEYFGSASGPEAPTRLGDLDADVEDDPDAMEGVEEAVRGFVESRGQSDSGDPSEVEAEKTRGPSPTQDAVPTPTFSGTLKRKQPASKPMQADDPTPTLSEKAKGKQRARPETDQQTDASTLSEVTDKSGSSSWRDRVIVSRPKPRERKQYPRKAVRSRPSGKLYDPPCRNCRKGRMDCEEPRAGGACVGCKRKKQACAYALIAAKKKVFTSKPEIESEDDDTDRPTLTAPPRPSLDPLVPPITTLTSFSPSRRPHRSSAPKPPPRLPTRAPPLREARLRASQAIQEAAGVRFSSPPTVTPRPVRRRSPSGSRNRNAVPCRFFFFHVNSTL